MKVQEYVADLYGRLGGLGNKTVAKFFSYCCFSERGYAICGSKHCTGVNVINCKKCLSEVLAIVN